MPLTRALPTHCPEKHVAGEARALAELGVPETRMLTAMNKVGLVGSQESDEETWRAGVRDALSVSAKTGFGLTRLPQEMSSRMQSGGHRVPGRVGRHA